MARIKLRIGDRVQIPNDSRVYEVMGLDTDQASGYALLKLRYSTDKSFWQAIANCEVIQCNR